MGRLPVRVPVACRSRWVPHGTGLRVQTLIAAFDDGTVVEYPVLWIDRQCVARRYADTPTTFPIDYNPPTDP